jgi:hypothetical protein
LLLNDFVLTGAVDGRLFLGEPASWEAAENGTPEETQRVISYVGQTVIETAESEQKRHDE